MTASPYKSITWSDGEAITYEDLSTMANNDQWLYENTPRMLYNYKGLKKTTGLKIYAASVHIPATKERNTFKDIYFGTFFTPGCMPVITLNHHGSQNRVHVSMRGLGGSGYAPNHNGFQMVLATDELLTPNVLFMPIDLHIIAVGY